MTQHRTSIADLARLLKLAPSTVSRALADHYQVSAATKQRVLRLAQELHYQPNQLATALRTGRTTTLGVLVPHLLGSFFAEVIDGITVAASQAGFHVLLCQSHEDVRREKQTIELFLNAQVAGVLVSLASSTQEFSHFEALRAAQVPLVFFDRAAEGLTGPLVSSIVLDDYAGAYAAVEHLIAEGHRRIAHFAGPLHLGIYQRRHQGYHDALRAHGLPYRAEWVCAGCLEQAAGAAGMQRLLGLASPPDAVFSSGDSATVGAMQAAKERGLRIPEDIALVGFSNADFTSLTEPALTTVDQGSRHMGGAAVRQLLKILATPAGAPPPPAVVLSPQLLIRASSRRAPAPSPH